MTVAWQSVKKSENSTRDAWWPYPSQWLLTALMLNCGI